MHFLYGLLTATAAIIAAEIRFDYSLGDFLKDFFIRIFHGAEGVAFGVEQRAKARLAAAQNRVKAVAQKIKATI